MRSRFGLADLVFFLLLFLVLFFSISSFGGV